MPRKRALAKKPVHLPKIASRKRRPARSNPGILDGVVGSLSGNGMIHALGGYTGSRLLGRIMRRVIMKKYPGLAKHATPLGNLLAAIAIYFTVKKWRKVREEAMIGASIAVAQAAVQAYLPGLAGLLMDTDAGLEIAGHNAAAMPTAAGLEGLGGGPRGRRRRGFVLPGEMEAQRAEAARGAPIESQPTGPVQYVNPGHPNSGYGAQEPTVDTFEDITAAGDDGDGLSDDLGIFQQ